MQDMARYGRNGDTMMAHVAPGEMVVPREVLQRNPQIARGLGRAFRDSGADPLRYTVSSGQNSINPITGEQEFFWKEIWEVGKKILGSPAGQAAATKVVTDLVQGNKPNLRDTLIAGAVGGGLGALTGDTGFAGAFGFGDAEKAASVAKPSAISAIDQKMGSDAASTIAKAAPVSSGYKEGLMGIGEMFGLNPKEGIGRLLNTKAGEAIALGLGSQLLSSVFDKEEETQADRDAARASRSYAEIMADPNRIKFAQVARPRGTAEQLQAYYAANPSPNFIRLNQGGAAYFPRRNGGIMPSEGSGTKDDVPAMLTAGEFVMTRDAVKGAGNGSLDRGIQKMYGMMDKLEGMA
jgi:hypothetical protein